MKSMKFLFLATAILVFGLVTTGCPSPVGGGSSASVSINVSRAKEVFAMSSRAMSGSYQAKLYPPGKPTDTPVDLDTKYSGLGGAGGSVTPTNFGMSFSLLELWSTDDSFLKFGEGAKYYNDFAVQNPWYSPQAIDPGKTFYCLQLSISPKWGYDDTPNYNPIALWNSPAIVAAGYTFHNGQNETNLVDAIPGATLDTNQYNNSGLDIYIADTFANAQKAHDRDVTIRHAKNIPYADMNPSVLIATGGGMTFTTEAGKTIVVTLNWDVANILRTFGGTTYLDQGWYNKITATHN